jgi:phytoene dehydrogenase-like protein
VTDFDVAVVGSGPNGLAAAVTMARAGLSVRVYEADSRIGGGARTEELTLPGFSHDVCSAVHPQALASPFFRAFELEKRMEFVVPDVSYAHPLDGGRAGIAYRDLQRTADGLGQDGRTWLRLFRPLLDHLEGVVDFTGGNLLRVPRDPIGTFGFGIRALAQGSPAWNAGFTRDEGPAMLTGVAAHAGTRLPSLGSAGTELLLGMHAHASGWPIPVGGSQSIVDAMASDLLAHGGEIVTDAEIRSRADLVSTRATLFDTSARAMVSILGDQVPDRYRRAAQCVRYGNGVAKVDFALRGPVPWANEGVLAAGTVHLGGTRAELAKSEAEVNRGKHPTSPYVLLSQPSGFDPSRAPEGSHVLWAYTHVPSGSTVDATEAITAQIERFAPGFRDVILASSARSARDLERHNSNYIGGDISGGSVSITQLMRRPIVSTDPWSTPVRGAYLCSASTPPGPSVHGMNGWLAARSALRRSFGTKSMPSLGLAD